MLKIETKIYHLVAVTLSQKKKIFTVSGDKNGGVTSEHLNFCPTAKME